MFGQKSGIEALKSEDAVGVIVLVGGLGGNAAVHGIEKSMYNIAMKAIKQKYIPVGFENLIYFQSHLPFDQRLALVGSYAKLDPQISKLAQAWRFTIRHSRPSARLVTGGRSTGSSLILEALHRDIKNNEFRDIFSRIKRILIMGAVDHRPEPFRRWKDIETAYLSDKDVDRFALNIEPQLFESMSYLSEFAVSKDNREFPEIVFVIGTNDPLSTAEEQIRLAREFQALHPNLSVKAIVTDTNHNPASSSSYELDGKKINVGQMKRLGPILISDIFSIPTTIKPKAFSLVIQPEAIPMLKLEHSCPVSLSQ